MGAGPVGLLAACELARRQIPVRIIDELASPTSESRAIVVHARSLEMLDRVGVLTALADSGVQTTGMEMHAAGHRLARVNLADVDSAFPFSITTAQTETERVLAEFLGTTGVTVERGSELIGLSQDDAGVSATVTHADGGQEVLAAPYVLGADGARSEVRRLVGTALSGSFKGEHFVMGDVDADCALDRHTMHTYFAGNAGPLMVFPMIGDRMRLIGQVPAADVSRAASVPWLQEIADDCGARCASPVALAHHLRDSPCPGACVSLWPGLPGRRRGARAQPGWRPGHEYRDAGRFQPGLEARWRDGGC